MIDTKQATLQQCNIVPQSEYLDEPVAQDHKHVLKYRRPFEYQKDLPTYWYNPANGQVIGPDGTKATIPSSTSLTALLEKIEESVTRKYDKKSASLYIVAGKNTKDRKNREWFNVYREWKQEMLLWRKLQARYTHNGFTVHLYGTCNFFGNGTDLDLMYEARNTLEAKLQRKFNVEGYKLLADTPAQSGRELLLISLPEKMQYPHLIGKPAEIVYHNLRYQGRVETFSQKRDVLEDGVYVLDARWMYASCLSHLPVGNCYHDKVNEFLATRTQAGKLYPIPGFYNVTVQVPENWHHIGIIKSGKSKSPIDDKGYYPNEPGQVFTNWVTAAEVVLLLDNPLGIPWQVQINERLVWPDTNKTTDPLATWIRYLRELRAKIEEKLKSNPDDKILALHKDMIRDIVIAATGSFHQYMTYENGFTPRSELPLNFTPYKFHMTLKGMEWVKAIPLSEYRQKWNHFEWSATAWGRARARVTTFALMLPYEDVINIRTDCVLCASKPEWLESKDTGEPGCFRQKGEKLPGPWPWPKNINEVEAYMATSKRSAELEDDFNDMGIEE